MNEIKQDLNKWRDIPYLWIARLQIIKMSVLPNSMYGGNTVPVNIQKASLWILTKPRSECGAGKSMERQKTKNGQHIKNKTVGLTIT